jgi:hypothetical protein
MATNVQTPKIMIDEVGVMFRARIVKVVPTRSALCISPEAFLDGKQLDLVVLPGLFETRKAAFNAAQAVYDVRFASYSNKQ